MHSAKLWDQSSVASDNSVTVDLLFLKRPMLKLSAAVECVKNLDNYRSDADRPIVEPVIPFVNKHNITWHPIKRKGTSW